MTFPEASTATLEGKAKYQGCCNCGHSLSNIYFVPKPATLNDISSLQGPQPALFQVWIHQVAEPEARAVDGVREQVPVPEAHPACAAVYHVWILP